MVESQPSKLLVAGSIPVSRSILRSWIHAKDAHHKLAERAAVGLPKVAVSYGWQALRGYVAAGLSAVTRSAKADVAQLAERVLGKDEVTSSILVIGSNLRSHGRERALRLTSQ